MSKVRILIPTTVALMGAVLLSACAPAGPQAAATPQPHTIAVTGEGQAFGAPDVANVSLGVSVTNTDVGAAVSQANDVMNRITSALGSLGIDTKDIQTTYYNVWPEQPINPQTGEPSGPTKYHVDSTLQVKVRKIDQTGAVIQKALDSGANTVNGLSFSIDDPKPLQSQARKAAVDDARQRAAELAAALGVTVGDPISVSETINAVPQPQIFAAEAAKGLGGGGVPVSTGQLSVDVQVEVTFALKP
jgi:uncharacterized protein YggE